MSKETAEDVIAADFKRARKIIGDTGAPVVAIGDVIEVAKMIGEERRRTPERHGAVRRG